MKNVVIVGGGAGGIELATFLGNKLGRKKQAKVTLVDRNATHLWKPLFHEIATGVMDDGTDSLSYRADRSQINVQQYNQWLDQFDFKQFADFDIWRESESEYDDFRQVKGISEKDLLLRSDEDFWCIGKSIEKDQLSQIDPVLFITQTIQQLQPLYDRCHQ